KWASGALWEGCPATPRWKQGPSPPPTSPCRRIARRGASVQATSEVRASGACGRGQPLAAEIAVFPAAERLSPLPQITHLVAKSSGHREIPCDRSHRPEIMRMPRDSQRSRGWLRRRRKSTERPDSREVDGQEDILTGPDVPDGQAQGPAREGDRLA